jgi:hypothetical protein
VNVFPIRPDDCHDYSAWTPVLEAAEQRAKEEAANRRLFDQVMRENFDVERAARRSGRVEGVAYGFGITAAFVVAGLTAAMVGV